MNVEITCLFFHPFRSNLYRSFDRFYVENFFQEFSALGWTILPVGISKVSSQSVEEEAYDMFFERNRHEIFDDIHFCTELTKAQVVVCKTPEIANILGNVPGLMIEGVLGDLYFFTADQINASLRLILREFLGRETFTSASFRLEYVIPHTKIANPKKLHFPVIDFSPCGEEFTKDFLKYVLPAVRKIPPDANLLIFSQNHDELQKALKRDIFPLLASSRLFICKEVSSDAITILSETISIISIFGLGESPFRVFPREIAAKMHNFSERLLDVVFTSQFNEYCIGDEVREAIDNQSQSVPFHFSAVSSAWLSSHASEQRSKTRSCYLRRLELKSPSEALDFVSELFAKFLARSASEDEKKFYCFLYAVGLDRYALGSVFGRLQAGNGGIINGDFDTELRVMLAHKFDVEPNYYHNYPREIDDSYIAKRVCDYLLKCDNLDFESLFYSILFRPPGKAEFDLCQKVREFPLGKLVIFDLIFYSFDAYRIGYNPQWIKGLFADLRIDGTGIFFPLIKFSSDDQFIRFFCGYFYKRQLDIQVADEWMRLQGRFSSRELFVCFLLNYMPLAEEIKGSEKFKLVSSLLFARIIAAMKDRVRGALQKWKGRKSIR